MKHPKSFSRVQLTGVGLLLIGSLVLSSCADPVEQPSEQNDTASGVEVPTQAPPEANTPPEPGAPTDMPTDAAALPDTVETAVLQDIASSYSASVEALEVTSAEAKSWPDGCLGLGEPDDICTFAIVEGWEVVVTGGEERWVYRTDADGFTVREADSVEG